MADKKRGAAAKSAPQESGGKLAAHQRPVAPIKGAPPHKGGPTLADRFANIEKVFGDDNPTDGLRARAGRKDILDLNQDVAQYVVFVEMVPAPDELEAHYDAPEVDGEGKVKKTRTMYTIESFDPAKIRAHEVGDRITGVSASSLEEAVAALEKKLGIGGDK